METPRPSSAAFFRRIPLGVAIGAATFSAMEAPELLLTRHVRFAASTQSLLFLMHHAALGVVGAILSIVVVFGPASLCGALSRPRSRVLWFVATILSLGAVVFAGLRLGLSVSHWTCLAGSGAPSRCQRHRCGP